MNEFRTAEVIMAFMNFGSEVQTGEFITECIKMGKKTVIPSVIEKDDERYLVPYEINDLEDVEIGTYGIREPCKGAILLEDKRMIDMVVVPGVVFGRNMHRIGYGKGFYDKFLRSIEDTGHVKVGVCFDLQLIAKVPADAHDVPLDAIVTEKEIVRGNEIKIYGGRYE